MSDSLDSGMKYHEVDLVLAFLQQEKRRRVGKNGSRIAREDHSENGMATMIISSIGKMMERK